MAHTPKLTVYIIELRPKNGTEENSNRLLFKLKFCAEDDWGNPDSFIFMEMCKDFIKSLDRDEMYRDDKSNKCITANQANLDDSQVNTNIFFRSENFIIEGKIEGGIYGRRRRKTNTTNKHLKDVVSEKDAITDDFYFLLYTPLSSNKSILLLQSYSDGTIDSVMNNFLKKFLSFNGYFNTPKIDKYIPEKIKEEFMKGVSVSEFTYTKDIPGETLLQESIITHHQDFEITVKIQPKERDINLSEFWKLIPSFEKNPIFNTVFGEFSRKKGRLVNSNGRSTPFKIEDNFEISPVIDLAEVLDLQYDDSDFERYKDYCFSLLEELKKEIYIAYAVKER